MSVSTSQTLTGASAPSSSPAPTAPPASAPAASPSTSSSSILTGDGPRPGPNPHQQMVGDGTRLSEAQIRKAYDHIVALGPNMKKAYGPDAKVMTREEADQELLTKYGLEPKKDAPTNEFERLYDQFNKAAKPEEFTTPMISPDLKDPIQRRAREDLQTNARGWLAAGHFSKDLGDGLIDAVDRGLTSTANLQEADRQSGKIGTTGSKMDDWTKKQHGMINQLWGNKYQENLNLTTEFVKAIDSSLPGFERFLRVSRMGDSADVIHALHSQARRLQARYGRVNLQVDMTSWKNRMKLGNA